MSNGVIEINGELHNDLCVGIDLGTTNSVLSIAIPKSNGELKSKVIEIPRADDVYNSMDGKAKLSQTSALTLPSCVYYREENGYKPLVGNFAKKQYSLRPHLVAKSIKSQMGNEYAEGLSEEIPDKTPAEISSRILEHLLNHAAKKCNCQSINDAIITVPANFDSSMCRATIEAAERAGVVVRNKDGSERPVLLSEPNAVIYDLINQIHNSEIPSTVLDLSEKRTVLVFDLGGGTLDITMHEIKRREENSDILKVEEIATNRYTLLGGDNFDEKIAETMYERFLNQYKRYPEAYQKIKKEKNSIMADLKVKAEQLKIDINNSDTDLFDDDNWGDEDSEYFDVGGGLIGGCGYAYDDKFSKSEIEEILKPFFAEKLCISDYKNVQNIQDTYNIIYPILDVLDKASKKINSTDIKIDAVIMNGGMSKFYMVLERLKSFFGFDPIVALDPDLSVARGAAVYHYYLHKYDSMQDDMRIVNQIPTHQSDSVSNVSTKKLEENNILIEWGNSILNDSLYLGLRNGNVQEIIPTGAELPYVSAVMTGFQLQPGQNIIAVPIKSRNLDGSYRTISTGNIVFEKKYPKGSYVAFRVYMKKNKVISMTAWTCNDEKGNDIRESGSVDIVIGNSEKSSRKTRVIASAGSTLNPKSEINNIIQLSKNFECGKGKLKSTAAQKLKLAKSGILSCSNKDDFASVILYHLLDPSLGNEAKTNLIIIARKIGGTWPDEIKKQIASICMKQIQPDMTGWSSGSSVNVSIQCVYALGIFGSETQLESLSPLHDNLKFIEPCLYVHGKTRTSLEWVYEQFELDVYRVNECRDTDLQNSAYAIGQALMKDGSNKKTCIDDNSVVESLCEVIRGALYRNCRDLGYIVPCIIALGLICDTRFEKSRISEHNILDVKHILYSLDEYCCNIPSSYYEKSGIIAMKMVNGESLSDDEEQYLLTKLESK